MFYLIGSKTSPLKHNLLQNWYWGENDSFKRNYNQAFCYLFQEPHFVYQGPPVFKFMASLIANLKNED